MPRNFDLERRTWDVGERTFVLGGETFVAKENVRPEVLAQYEDVMSEDGRTLTEFIKATDDTLLAMIEDPDGDRAAAYLALREREDTPVTLNQLGDLVRWLFEQYTARPTSPPSPSSNGVGGTGTNSTATSSTPATAAVPTA
jgi:hypothetical protein